MALDEEYGEVVSLDDAAGLVAGDIVEDDFELEALDEEFEADLDVGVEDVGDEFGKFHDSGVFWVG